jgi:hypothetical protein
MKKVNSISGGKTSAYMAKHFPADIELFSLVRIEDKENIWMKGKDEKTRQLVSDKIGMEFIGTAEMDTIIYTILDLEQFIGREIKFVTGETFEQIIKNHNGYLPNKMTRYCTIEMKIIPMFNYLKSLDVLPVEMNLGFRPNETNRIENVLSRADENGLEKFKTIIGKSKKGNQNKWGLVDYRFAKFPLAENNITKDVIYDYWNNKPVRFAYRNNCVACVNRQPLMISHMANKDLDKVKWFEKQELITGNTFINGFPMKKILNFGYQNTFFDEDFSDCDSGYCGI